VAVAGEDVFLWPVKYRAGGVGAEAAEREKCSLRRMQQETRVFFIRVGDDFHAADGDVSHTRDDFNWVGIFSRVDEGDEAAESGGDARGS
jgi:hypothetical protein